MKPKKPVYETGTCIHCKGKFQRLARGCRSKQVCDREQCRKIMRLGHEKPVSLSTVPSGNTSFLGHQNSYHGGYTE